jgi:hypothetical protein
MKQYDRAYLVDWLPPDFGATGQYIQKFAKKDADAGLSVILIGLTSSTPVEEVDELEGSGRLITRRIKSRPPVKKSNLSRLSWAIKANLSLISRSLFILARTEEVIITGSPPFLLFFVVPLKKVLRFRLRYRLTDFYPEVIFAEAKKFGLMAKSLIYLTNMFRRSADIIEVLGEDQADRLGRYGFIRGDLVLRRDDSPVLFDEQLIAECTVESNQPQGRSILYSGNWGVAHDTETFLEACSQASSCNVELDICIQSSSPIAQQVHKALCDDGVRSEIKGNLPLSELGRSLLLPDLHLITLKTGFWGYVMPSKVYACIESGRAILYIGPKKSDVYLLCSTYRTVGEDFFHFDCGDTKGVAGFFKARYGSSDRVQS